jgi:hypothetical protein
LDVEGAIARRSIRAKLAYTTSGSDPIMRAYAAITSGAVLIASLSFLTYGLKTNDGLLVTIYGPTGWKNREREPLMYWLALGEWAFLALAGAALLLAAIFLPH